MHSEVNVIIKYIIVEDEDGQNMNKTKSISDILIKNQINIKKSLCATLRLLYSLIFVYNFKNEISIVQWYVRTRCFRV